MALNFGETTELDDGVYTAANVDQAILLRGAISEQQLADERVSYSAVIFPVMDVLHSTIRERMTERANIISSCVMYIIAGIHYLGAFPLQIILSCAYTGRGGGKSAFSPSPRPGLEATLASTTGRFFANFTDGAVR